jgi:hypothetical protein
MSYPKSADEVQNSRTGISSNRLDSILAWHIQACGAVGILWLVFAASGCQRSSPEAVTLTFIDAEVLDDLSSRKLLMEQALREFTLQTGIRVNYLPAPENNRDRLALDRKLLQEPNAFRSLQNHFRLRSLDPSTERGLRPGDGFGGT